MNELNEREFEYVYFKHIEDLFSKYRKFITDFNLLNDVLFVDKNKKNPYQEAHMHENEPQKHFEAKQKLFNLFLADNNFLTNTEVTPVVPLDVPSKGERAYRPDILVVNVTKYMKFRDVLYEVLMGYATKELPLKVDKLMEIEKSLVFAFIEIDGMSHSSDWKDTVRDDYFFSTYNIITLRYTIDHLVKVEDTDEYRKAQLQYGYFKKDLNPIYHNITSSQIITEYENIYKKKYSYLFNDR